MSRNRRALRGTALVLAGVGLALLGCGKYGPPVRPAAPTYDEGTIYDAGQPIDRRREP